MAKPKFIIYSKKHCSFCDKTKVELTRLGHEYEERDVELNPAVYAEMQVRAPGAKTVPQIFIGEKSMIRIGTYMDLVSAIGKGTLDLLIETSD